MCGCSANFDGHNSVEEVEESKFLDFDGEVESMEVDGEFENFIRFGNKKDEHVSGLASAYTDYNDCMANKPALRTKNTWTEACVTAHGSPSGGSGNSNDEWMPPASDNSSSDNSSSETKEGMSKVAKIGLVAGSVVALGLVGLLVFKAVKK